MCGVLGIVRVEEGARLPEGLAAALFMQSSIRGLHSFGVSACRGEARITDRHHSLALSADTFADRCSLWPVVLGHARYSTSGDFRNLANAQPIERGGRSLVFNGVISMKTREEMEAEYGTRLVVDNDGELFLAALQDGADPVAWLERSRASFAGLWTEPSGAPMALRNDSRPLWLTQEVEGYVVVASTNDILRRSGLERGRAVPSGQVIPLWAVPDTSQWKEQSYASLC